MCFLFQKGHVKCNTVKCPALSCAHPVAEPRRCCPKCTGPMFVRRLYRLKKRKKLKGVQRPCVSASGDPVRIPAGLRASVKSCSYNGTIYQPGETFSKRDLFPAKQRNQCAMCTCAVSTRSRLKREGRQRLEKKRVARTLQLLSFLPMQRKSEKQ